MRLVLTVGLVLSGCSFYQPDLTDCVLPCGADALCPEGLTCVEGLCRPPGKTTACECTVGKTRPWREQRRRVQGWLSGVHGRGQLGPVSGKRRPVSGGLRRP